MMPGDMDECKTYLWESKNLLISDLAIDRSSQSLINRQIGRYKTAPAPSGQSDRIMVSGDQIGPKQKRHKQQLVS